MFKKAAILTSLLIVPVAGNAQSLEQCLEFKRYAGVIMKHAQQGTSKGMVLIANQSEPYTVFLDAITEDAYDQPQMDSPKMVDILIEEFQNSVFNACREW